MSQYGHCCDPTVSCHFCNILKTKSCFWISKHTHRCAVNFSLPQGGMCEWITSNNVSFSNQKHVCVWKSQYLQDDEEFISGLSLHYNLLSVLELDGLQGVSHRQTLPFVKRLWGGQTETAGLSSGDGQPGGLFSFERRKLLLSQVGYF